MLRLETGLRPADAHAGQRERATERHGEGDGGPQELAAALAVGAVEREDAQGSATSVTVIFRAIRRSPLCKQSIVTKSFT